jgi:hypothetical protein
MAALRGPSARFANELPPPVGLPTISAEEMPPMTVVSESDHRWTRRIIAAVVLILCLGGAIFVWTSRSSAPESQRACERLRMPGLTLAEGRQIIDSAVAHGVAVSQLRQQCPTLVDGFGGAQAAPSTAP